MTQEEKQLLLKDLCARLSYGIIASVRGSDEEFQHFHILGVKDDKVWAENDILRVNDFEDVEVVKPYLRPISSMTEEEHGQYMEFIEWSHNDYDGTTTTCINKEKLHEYIDFIYSHHLDDNGLIEKGLALEAPEGMYNKEESEKDSEIPVPKTVEGAVKTLAKILSKEDRDYLLENGAISMHDSLGRWIRNEWGLWTDSELKNELKKKGFEHPDDMSNYIIEEFIKYWNNKV